MLNDIFAYDIGSTAHSVIYVYSGSMHVDVDL